MAWHDFVSAQNHAEDMVAGLLFMTAKPVSYETFSLSQSQYPRMFCVSTKGGSGGGGNVCPKGEMSTKGGSRGGGMFTQRVKAA